MPIYEYVCHDCGHRFEWLVRADERPTCPSCGRSKLGKLLSVPAAHSAGTSAPACSAREQGLCGAPNCCGNQCGLGDWS